MFGPLFLVWEVSAKSSYPPPHHLLKALLGTGFAKSVCKILMSNILEVKILRTNALASRSLISGDCHGLDYDCAGADWGQGQMSQCSCEKGKTGGSLPAHPSRRRLSASSPSREETAPRPLHRSAAER